MLRLDPEWFLSGATASAAAAEDGAVEPGQPVPNDNYRVDEGHRLFTFKVPADARVSVITKAPTGTPITNPKRSRANCARCSTTTDASTSSRRKTERL